MQNWTGSIKRVNHNVFGKQHGKMEGARITAPHQLSSNSGSAAHCETRGRQHLLCGFAVWVNEIAVTNSKHSAWYTTVTPQM